MKNIYFQKFLCEVNSEAKKIMKKETIKKILTEEANLAEIPDVWDNVKKADLRKNLQTLSIENKENQYKPKLKHKKAWAWLGIGVPIATGLVLFFTLVLPPLLNPIYRPSDYPSNGPTFRPPTRPNAEVAAAALAHLELQVDEAIRMQENIYNASELNGGFIVGADSFIMPTSISEEDNDKNTEFNIRHFIAEVFYSRDRPIPTLFQTMINTYVIDLFMFSQVKLSLLDTFGNDALEKIFDVYFDQNDEFMSVFRAPSRWPQFIPYRASFPGVDTETGKVYMVATGHEGGSLTRRHHITYMVEYFFTDYNDLSITLTSRRYDDLGELMVLGIYKFDALTQTTIAIEVNVSNLYNVSLMVNASGINNAALTESERETLIKFVLNSHQQKEATIYELEQENLRLAQIVREFEEYELEQEENEEYYYEYKYSEDNSGDTPLLKNRHPYPHLVSLNFDKLRILQGVV